MTLHPTARAGAAALVAALALGPLAGCTAASGLAAAPPARPTTSAPAPSPATPGPSAPSIAQSDIPRTDIDSRANPQGPPPQAPARVAVSALGIDMPVNPVGLDATGDVSIPSASGTAGWYRFSSGMDDRTGTIVIVAHVDAWDGIGPFSRLKDAAPGTVVQLTGANGTRSFRIDNVVQPPKAPGSLASYFVSTGPARLVLITCGGVFDDSTGHYRDNVVATASPVDG